MKTLKDKVAEDIGYSDFEWLMNINFWGVVHGTKAFLPYLKQSGERHIVNVSSLFGIITFPISCAYNASKFAVRGFTESLRLQLEKNVMYRSRVWICVRIGFTLENHCPIGPDGH